MTPNAVAATGVQPVIAGPLDPEQLDRSQYARRQRIVRAAMSALTRSSYDEVKMTAIAKDAGVALGTLYRYFSSKEHLFTAVLREWQGALDARLTKVALRGDTEAERVLDFYGRILTAFELQPQFLRMLMVVEMTSDPYAARMIATAGAAFRSQMSTVFDEWDEHRANIAYTMSSVLFNGLRAWSMNRMTIADVRARVASAIDLIYNYSREA